MASDASIIQPLIAKLSHYGELSPEERQSLEGAVADIRVFEPEQDIVVEGATPDHSSLLLSGFAGRTNMSIEGQRQITALHVAGDFVDLHSFLMKPMDHSIGAISTCRIATVPHTALTRITEEHPRLTRLLWLNTLVDAGMHRRWEFALGTLQGHEHLAHLICELFLRVEQIGATDNGSFHLPITQAILSECLALSHVHANRVVQKLRSENLIRWERDVVTIVNWDGWWRWASSIRPTFACPNLQGSLSE
jgi:CRP-like cAMP-binding protein